MPRTGFLKHIRKAGAFASGELASGEIGVNTAAAQLEFSPDGSTIKTLPLLTGSAAPEGSITAPPGTLYSRSNGEIYRKATGTGNTGWRALNVRQEFFTLHFSYPARYVFGLESSVSLYGLYHPTATAPTLTYARASTPFGAQTTFTTWPQTFTPGQELIINPTNLNGNTEVIGCLLIAT